MRWRRVRFVFASVAVIVVARSARSSCAFQATFGQLNPSCGSSYCYVVTPGVGSSQSMDGAFWTFGFGSPATAAGADDGTSTLDSWLPAGDGGRYLLGDWTATGVDGCATGHIASGKPAEIMVADIEDDSYSGGLFAVAAARRFPSAYPEYDFTFAAGGGQPRNIALVEIPRARIVESARDHFVFGSPDFTAVSMGVYTDGSMTPPELVVGYRIFRIAGCQNPITGHRKSTGWTAITGTIPFGQNVTIPWNGQSPIHFAYGLVFESGFETVYVGSDITVHGFCDCPPDDDGDGFPPQGLSSECCPVPEACDCNDLNPAVHPGATELCNGIDDNCDGIVDNVALPGAPSLRIEKLADGSRVSWDALAVATSYDLVRGDLVLLGVSAGNFTASTTSCAANDAGTAGVDDAAIPDPDQGFWYLVRAANCAGQGSYDSPDPSQAAPRDAGIAGSGSNHACP